MSDLIQVVGENDATNVYEVLLSMAFRLGVTFVKKIIISGISVILLGWMSPANATGTDEEILYCELAGGFANDSAAARNGKTYYESQISGQIVVTMSGQSFDLEVVDPVTGTKKIAEWASASPAEQVTATTIRYEVVPKYGVTINDKDKIYAYFNKFTYALHISSEKNLIGKFYLFAVPAGCLKKAR